MRLSRPVYRAHHPRWSFDPHSGVGAARFGGRFNPVGTAALYTSLPLETAWLEAQQAFPFKAQPMTLCAYEVDCDGMLDLTNPATLAGFGITQDYLACPWEDQRWSRWSIGAEFCARRWIGGRQRRVLAMV